MKLVFAPDSFKGSLSAEKVCRLLKREAERVFPGCETIALPVSDGGEGAVNVLLPSVRGKKRKLFVKGPLGERTEAQYGIFGEGCALIEMAAASGLTLVPTQRRNIMKANTWGTGQMILDALSNGCSRLYIAIGGSATSDGGMGCADALGVRFLDKKGDILQPLPENLGKIEKIDTENLHPDLKKAEVFVMCDVTNPLTGKNGAVNVFGPQKGGTKEELEALEKGMLHYEKILKDTFGREIGLVPGAGAAGGLGAGLVAFAGAKLVSGIEAVLEILQFEKKAAGADLVVTGEGRIDGQSAWGKVLWGVGSLCKKNKIPCIAIAGSIGEGAEELEKWGISGMFSLLSEPVSLETAMSNAEKLFSDAAYRMFRMVQVGMEIKNTEKNQYLYGKN